jgi:hypothetical protein
VTPKKVGRPAKTKKKREKAKRRDKYKEEDMQEAMGLVRDEGYSVKRASEVINDVMTNKVPCMTLSDHLKRSDVFPPLGRPQEQGPAVEEALVQCLEMCAQFQYRIL